MATTTDNKSPVHAAQVNALTEQPAGPTRTQSTKKVLTAYGKTMLHAHPLYLMGEAVTGKKVGSGFKASGKDLLASGQLLRESLASSASDVLVIVNETLQGKDKQALKSVKDTSAVLKEAGSNAIVVVTKQVDGLKLNLDKSGPPLKRALAKHSREAIVVIDSSLKNPLVISGVTKFAKSRGIPASEAMLSVASLALSKILAAIPEENQFSPSDFEGIDEIDAELLEARASGSARREETRVQQDLEEGEVAQTSASTPTAAKKNCIIS